MTFFPEIEEKSLKHIKKIKELAKILSKNYTILQKDHSFSIITYDQIKIPEGFYGKIQPKQTKVAKQVLTNQ